MDSHEYTLLEELMLIALHDEKGSLRASAAFPYGLAGAALIELSLQERVHLEEGKFLVVTDRKPTGDPVLDEVLALMSEAKRRKRIKAWVRSVPSKVKHMPRRVSEQLVDRGVLKVEEGKVLWVFPITRYPQRNPGPEKELRQRLRRAVFRSQRLDDRTACLLALVGALKLTGEIFERERRGEANRRIKEITRSSAFGKAVGQVVQEMQAAVTAALVGAGAAS